MSRLDKLKRLKDEVNRLFHERFDETAVVDQLRTVEQFADASYEQIQVFYSNLVEKSNIEARDKRKITRKDRQITELQQTLEHLQQTPSNERQIEEHERELAEKQQMKTELGLIIKYLENSNNFLLYDEPFDNWIFCKNFWQERFLMTVESGNQTDNVHLIKVRDLLQGTTKSFTVQKVGRLYAIYALKFPFLLLDEFYAFNSVTYFRLVKFDLESDFLQIVQSYEFNGVCQVLISASDASKFLLRRGNDVNKCELASGQIQVGKKLLLDSDFHVNCGSYFDEQLCRLQFESSWDNQFRNHQLTQVKMLIYNLGQNENPTQDIDSTPENVDCLSPLRPKSSTWIRDTIFLTFRFPLTRKYGVIFTNPQLRNWKFVEYATDLYIDRIQSFVDGSLMICSEEERERRVYKLQMRKPDFLRNMAWSAMVKLLKEAKIDNPYEEARQYLPLNSEIQPFVFTED